MTFQVTRLAKADDLAEETRHRIFDSVGFTFLNRLLNTVVVPEGCPSHIFRSLALTVLACFATDEQMISSPEMLEKIPLFCEIALSAIEHPSDSGTVSMADDCLHCLTALSVEPKTVNELIKRGAVPCLVKRACEGCQVCLGILLRLASSPEETPLLYSRESPAVLVLINNLAAKFKEDQSSAKFDLCDHLAILIHRNLQLTSPLSDSWPQNIQHGLSDILRSKIAPILCQRALALAGSMANCLGFDWIILTEAKPDQKTEFVKLLFHRTVVETRMVLDGKCVEEILERDKESSVLYNILEHFITFLVTFDSQSDHVKALIGSEDISQIHGGIKDCLGDVTAFLDDVNSSNSREDYVKSPLVSMSVRLLGSWIAEETVALQEQVIELIPFLVELGRKSSANNWDLLRFLLPGLCHLSSDETARQKLIESECLSLLVGFFCDASDKLVKKNKCEERVSLVTCCGVLLNFSLLEPVLVAESGHFTQLFEHVLLILPKLVGDENLVLKANCIVLSLMLLRHQHHKDGSELQGYMQLVVEYIGAAYEYSPSSKHPCILSSQFSQVWNDVEELWLLAGRVLSECLTVYSFPVRSAKWVKSALAWLTKSEIESEHKEMLEGLLKVSSKAVSS